MFKWKRTFYYRRPPYPYYDIEGIESWLESLADKGLFLDKDGYVFGLMQFQRGTPCKTKYRLEAIQRKSFLQLHTPDDPDEKALTLFEEFGWEYLGQFFDFYIYRSVGEDAPELNTDPTVQAMTLENVKKRSRQTFLLLLLLTAAAFYLLLFKGRPISRVINDGWLTISLLLAAVISAVVASLTGFLHIAGLQKKLNRGEPLSREKNWKRGVLLRRLWIVFPTLLLIAYHVANLYSVSPIEDHAIDPDSYQRPLPFATVSELAPEREYVPEAQQLSQWYDPLSPVNLFWYENARLEAPGENSYLGSLEIYYHETAAEWIAIELMAEYLDVQKNYSVYTPVTVSAEEYGFDSLEIYESYYGAYIYIHVYIRDGNTVIKAFSSLRIRSDNDHLYPLWLDLMAEKMA